MNIDFLKCAIHSQTEDYLDMLYSNSFLPVITKPTRITPHSATLIDHIYTNTSANVISGIGLIDISDHLPIFCIADVSINHSRGKIHFRDYTHFSHELYIQDINAIDWNVLISSDSNINDLTNSVIRSINNVIEKHAPIRMASRNKQKQLRKPWITNAILKSIKNKQSMYKTHFLSTDPDKVAEYKKFSNKLNHVKSASKKTYFSKRFELCKNNLKATWKLIGALIKRKPTGCITPSRIVGNNKVYTDKADVCEQFNQYFINVGPQLASTIPQNSENPIQYIKKTPSSSFVMSPVTEGQVSRLFSNLDVQKASLDIPNKLIKIAAEPLSKPLTFI